MQKSRNNHDNEGLCSSWVLYDDEGYSGNQYVLSEGDYPSLSSMGCPPGCTIRSVKLIPMVREVRNARHCLIQLCSERASLPRLDSLGSLHLLVRPRVFGGQRDHHRHGRHQHGGGGLQQPRPLGQSQQRLVSHTVTSGALHFLANTNKVDLRFAAQTK